MLDRTLAAAYCGVSVNHFLTHCPVGPAAVGSKKVWDRKAIDRWLDGLDGTADTTPTEEWLARA